MEKRKVKSILLSKRLQSEKTTNCMIQKICHSGTGYRDSRSIVPKVSGKGGMNWQLAKH